MKKLIILFIAILFGAATSFATNPPTVRVEWAIGTCVCVPASANDYYKITISIYDNANSIWVYTNFTRTTADTDGYEILFEVEDMPDYCKDSHPNTPSFTVTATVWYIQTTPDPDVECCTASEVLTGNCHDFEFDDIFPMNVGGLN